MTVQSIQHLTREDRRAAGRACRDKVSRLSQAQFDPMARKFDPIEVLRAAHAGRVEELLPLKFARMASTPFTFYRGAAPVMAADLAQLPRTGIDVQICGDAHVQNLGAYGGGADGHLIFDINDFDETIKGPWEWDVKRMAASLILAGREARNSERQCKDAVQHFSRTYRKTVRDLSELSVIELARYQVTRHLNVSPVLSVLRKAEHATPQRNLAKLTIRENGKSVFRELIDPEYQVPLQYRVPEATAKQVLAALPGYVKTLLPERHHMFAQYHPVDVGFRVVGTGSVGTRDYVVLMFAGALDDPLVLQLKQELPSTYERWLPNADPPKHHGQRVVEGVRRMLVQFDIFMGWANIDGRPYLVRQLKDHKAGVEDSDLEGKGLLQYAEVCGELLAKGHARSGDPCMLSGYLGTAERFDGALVNFAVDYADQGTRDFEKLLKAIREGSVKALKPAPAEAKRPQEKKKPQKARKKPAGKTKGKAKSKKAPGKTKGKAKSKKKAKRKA